jgi:peptidoglycan hydrolase CwlO-like protein
MSREEFLVLEIEELNNHLEMIRIKIKNLKEQISSEETEFIETKLDIEKLTEELRRLRLMTIKR